MAMYYLLGNQPCFLWRDSHDSKRRQEVKRREVSYYFLRSTVSTIDCPLEFIFFIIVTIEWTCKVHVVKHWALSIVLAREGFASQHFTYRGWRPRLHLFSGPLCLEGDTTNNNIYHLALTCESSSRPPPVTPTTHQVVALVTQKLCSQSVYQKWKCEWVNERCTRFVVLVFYVTNWSSIVPLILILFQALFWLCLRTQTTHKWLGHFLRRSISIKVFL